MNKINFQITGLTLLLCSGLVAGSSDQKNLVLALGPWDNSAPELVTVWSADKWLESQAAAKQITGSETVKFYANTGLSSTAKTSKAKSLGVPCEETFSVELTPALKSKHFEIGVSATWNPRPRAITVLPNNSVPYLKIANDFLAQKGIKNQSVKLTSVLRTDIDNDKSFEVFMVGRNFQDSANDDYFPPAKGQQGDYSFVLMRKIIAGKVQTISLGSDVILKDSPTDSSIFHLPQFFDLAGVLDLNGDGKLEVIEYSSYYEGYSFEVLEWTGSKFVSRAQSGCGS